MKDIEAAFLSVLIVAPVAVPTLIWIGYLRPYLRKAGGTTITGANWVQSAWGDWTLAREVAKKRNEKPWFISAFPTSLLLWIICPAIAVSL